MAEEKKTLELEQSPSDVSLHETTMQKHSPLYIAVIIGTCVMYLILLLFNYLNGLSDGTLFISNIGNTSDFFFFEITPAGWAFSIWGLIYTYQFVWLIYAVVSIFRTSNQSRLYLVPTIPLSAFIVYMTNNVAVIAWLFTFDRKMIELSLVALIYTPASLIVALILSFREKANQIQVFNLANQRYESILLDILVHNAWAVYLGWTICAMLLNWGFVIIYRFGASQELGGIIVLSMLLTIIVVGCMLELTIFDKYLRYVFMHYVGPLIALIGSVAKQSAAFSNNHVSSGINRSYAIAILCIALLFTLAKVLSIIFRSWKQPLYYQNNGSKVGIDEEKA